MLGIFEFKGPTKPVPLASKPKIKPPPINKSASNVAAYFNRRLEKKRLSAAQRSTIKRLDQRFYELRRTVIADERLTRQDKAQLVSVLTFERLKVRQSIESPSDVQEDDNMGSAAIRDLMSKEDPEADAPMFSISSGAAINKPLPIRERVKFLVSKLDQEVSEEEKQERERVLNSHDLYTKKARFSQSVHYLDKQTNKTVFVDTGKAITLRRNGLTESGVALALQMAQSRFGSTLKINGSEEFKNLVVEAAVKNKMDIHFTDKAMNDRMAERRAELELGSDGLNIEAPTAAEKTVAEISDLAQTAAKDAGLKGLTLTESLKSDAGLLRAYVDGLTGRSMDFYTTQGQQGVKISPESWAELRQLQQAAESAMESLKLAPLPATATTTPAATTARAPEDSKTIIRGLLLDHGPAPYQHDINKERSYYVSVKTPEGVRTLWGIGLEQALQDQKLQNGERVVLQDLGTQPVSVPERQKDGTVINVSGHRREWSAERETVGRDVPKAVTPKPASTKPVTAKPIVNSDPAVAVAITRLENFSLDKVSPEEMNEVTAALNAITSMKGGKSIRAESAADRLARKHLMAFTEYYGFPAEMMMALAIKNGMDQNPRYKQTILEEAPADWLPAFTAAGLVSESVVDREATRLKTPVVEQQVREHEEGPVID